ncbi:Oxidoreductase family, NAD-binding Rossmann fold [Acididesulfobacillus acetoxydans]|uniref:Oxidoreductase domain protein n=1 Tax=Acididesulfobacillus acetoxydans TaxID=1561005 RepID=A0A8S0XXZ8_9FIRM|nr:oxidoreductase [Acididesulfobacillus acetoxydans]CAA7601997.1 Oxidoreductase family, NAD-binding Rossmann fold [Acididesulfobacillus acetoxydans]CEJ08160.1 Oxidoreductase domain protein [Acididesulfobacillus acetoxydans]
MTDKINVGLLGYGFAGQVFHAPLINAVPSLNMYAVVERHGDKAVRHYPGIRVYKSSQELLQDRTVDLVVVATPNSSHFELAREALMADKHVVVDKPFTPTATEARSLIELAQRQGRILSVYQNRRWDGDFRTVQALIKGGILGEILEYEVHYDRFRAEVNPEAWRESGEPGSGILFDLGSHLIDQALVLFGQPDTVTADLRVQREGGKAVDNFEIILTYPELKATLKAGMFVREPGPRFTLQGRKGSFLKYGFDPQEDALKAGQTPDAVSAWGVEAKTQWGKLNAEISGVHFVGFIETLPGSYQAFYENVSDAILHGRELRVKPEEA